MNYIEREMRRVEVELAARLPSLADGGSVKDPVWQVRPRKDGCWRVFKDGVYWGTTRCKEEADARQWLRIFLLQRAAEADGVNDVRRVPALVVIKHREKAVVRKGLRGAAVIASTLKALKRFVGQRQLRHLTDDWAEENEAAMVAAGYSREYAVNAVRFLRTAVRQYTRKTFGAAYLPFDAPTSPAGRTTVVSDTQRDRVKRWGLGSEAYDPKTGRWREQPGLPEKERRDRQVAYREIYLGLVFGSRPGAYAKLSWEPHDEGGWIDLDGATFHRVPPGTATPSNKRAPAVPIPDEVLSELRRWKAEDGDCPWVFRTLDGGPMSQAWQQKIFARAMAALGIAGVTGHVLRHSCITRLIEKGTTAPSISAVCGVSIRMLYKRYGHFENRAVQMLAHDAMAGMMG
jgi:integrase